MDQKLTIESYFHEVRGVIIDFLFLAIFRIKNCGGFLFRARFFLATIALKFFSSEQKEVLTALSEIKVENLILRVLVVWLTNKLGNHAILLNGVNIVSLIDFWLPEVLLLWNLHLIFLCLTVLKFNLFTEF